ncbi:MAG TPA: hypothetical protein VFP20_01440 [Bacteroidales bacterium]|nr:hypothetical protein [Bacteroidales bacterium]
MKPITFSFVRPMLTLLDNGKFFRKPFGWFYAVIAVSSLLAPIFLVYTTIWWNKANQDKLQSQRIYQEVTKPEYLKAKYAYDTLSKAVEAYAKEMNNAVDCLTKATKQADYYGEYASYGPEYQQIYDNALDVKKQWEEVYKDASNRWDASNNALDAQKPKFDKVKLLYQKAEADYKAAEAEFQLVNQFGTVFNSGEMHKGSAIVGLILFSIMILLLGALNFLLWWSRLIDLKSLIKVQDTFVAVPLASHFIQTCGESLGMIISIWGFFTALIFYTCNLSIGQFGLDFESFGILSIFLPIILGFLVIFIFRILAELLKVGAVKANKMAND